MERTDATRGVSTFLSRPIGRAMVVLGIGLAAFALWRGMPPPAVIAVVNASAAPIEALEVTLTEGRSRVKVERVETLAPGARWEFQGTGGALRVDTIRFRVNDREQRHEAVGDAAAGQALTLTLRPSGRLDRQQSSITQ